MSLGAGDRPFTGAHPTHEALLQKLGTEDYDKLLKGKLPWYGSARGRYAEMAQELRSMRGLLPTTFTSLKLGESHTYFHTNPGALMFMVGSWYTSRAFNTPDKGGQPDGFPLGIMQMPAVPNAACNECRTIAVGGSYVINADTKHPKKAVAFLNSLRDAGNGQQMAGDACWCRPASRVTPRKSPARMPNISRCSRRATAAPSIISACRSR